MAVLLRAPNLADRPFHTDEAVNAFILEEMFSGGYTYRAHDHHGPLLYYAAGAVLGPLGLTRAAQMTEESLRAVTCAAGVLLALSPFLFVGNFRTAQGIADEEDGSPQSNRKKGVIESLASGLGLAALAPFVYYSGIFIHETFLVLLLAVFAAAFWRLHQSGSRASAVWAGAAAGLMLGTKETAGIILPIVGLSIIATHLRQRGRGANPAVRAHHSESRLPWMGYLLTVVIALIATLFLYSDLGRKPDHAFDLFRAVGPQTDRGLGTEHAYPWYTYAKWLLGGSISGVAWGGYLLVGLAAAGSILGRRHAFWQMLTLWAAGLFVAFSALPYKTPWLMLVWLYPLVLLAGHAIASAYARWRLPAIALAVVVLALVLRDTYSRCFLHAVDPRNSLAYSPSSGDLARLQTDLHAWVGAKSATSDPEIHVIARDYWPLPWTLRKLARVGYWSDGATIPPNSESAAAVLLGPEQLGHYASADELRPYELRPGVFVFLKVP